MISISDDFVVAPSLGELISRGSFFLGVKVICGVIVVCRKVLLVVVEFFCVLNMMMTAMITPVPIPSVMAIKVSFFIIAGL